MTTSGTIEPMTPAKKRIQWYWVCQRPQCRHEWPAKDINIEPKRCAKCKRLDWNRATKAIGRPRNQKPKQPKNRRKR